MLFGRECKEADKKAVGKVEHTEEKESNVKLRESRSYL